MRRGLLILAFLAPVGVALVLTTARNQPVAAQDDRAQARMQARIKDLEARLEVLEKNLEANNRLIETLQARLGEAEPPAAREPERPADREPERPAGPRRPLVVLPLNVKPVTKEDLIKDPKAVASALVRVYRWHGEGYVSKTFHVIVGKALGEKAKTRAGLLDFYAGTLLGVEIRTRTHPRLGFDQQVHVIRYKTPEGAVREATHRDPPPE